jgi:hypothetical protein
MGFWAAAAVICAIVVAQMFGPRLRRSAISKRLAAGSLQVTDRASVTMIGTIRALGGELIEAPLSGRSCVVAHAQAELPEIDSRRDLPENVMLTTRRMIPFELDTPSGVVLVDGTEADLDFKPTRVPQRSADRERAFIVAHGRGEQIAATATFREVVLTPGMQVAVHGIAMIEVAEKGGERGYRDAAPMRTRLVAHPSYPIAIGKPRPP